METLLPHVVYESKPTPCFRLSLAWSETSDTITRAAAAETDRRTKRVTEIQQISGSDKEGLQQVYLVCPHIL